MCNKGHHCLRFSPRRESYASGSEDGTVRGGKHLQLLESSTMVPRDFRNYFSAKRKSPYQYIQCMFYLYIYLCL
ncbi:hypothetical protein Hanom_Chr13g01222681 [Helianthus anomalus]